MLDNFPRIFVKDLETEGTLQLPKDQAHHLVRVLRAKPADRLELFDGRGHVGDGVLLDPSGSTVNVENIRETSQQSRVSVCFGLGKSKAVEFILRQADF